MKTSVAVVLAVVLGLTTASVAGTSQGDTEITIFGTVQYVKLADVEAGEDDSQTTIMAGGSCGYFFTDAFEVAGTGVGSWSEDYDLYGIGVAGKYHFATGSNVVPYVGALINATFLAPDEGDNSNGILYGPVAGVKFFVSEKTNVFAEYQYHAYSGDIGDFIDNDHTVIFGVSFLLR